MPCLKTVRISWFHLEIRAQVFLCMLLNHLNINVSPVHIGLSRRVVEGSLKKTEGDSVIPYSTNGIIVEFSFNTFPSTSRTSFSNPKKVQNVTRG